jgi:hypothetical protein
MEHLNPAAKSSGARLDKLSLAVLDRALLEATEVLPPFLAHEVRAAAIPCSEVQGGPSRSAQPPPIHISH